jgi:FAS-associated factor 2
VLSFIQNYNQKYSTEHPVFYQGTYAQALNDAKRELKFLLVFLHSDTSEESVSFCRTTLRQPDVIEYINRNFFLWGCDIEKPEGYRVSHSINARRQCPTLVIVGLRSNKMIIMGRMEGTYRSLFEG